MRVPIGTCAVCSLGRPGLITDFVELTWGWTYVGIGLDDGTPWASRNPQRMTYEELNGLRLAKLEQS